MTGESRGIHALGAGMAALYLTLALSSKGRAAVPIEQFLGTVGIGWMLALVACGIARGEGGRGKIVFWGLVPRLCGLFACPIYEDDYFRYLWDGWRFWQSGNPYDRAPIEFFADATVPHRLQAVLSGINHPDLPTIYGPVCQLVFLLAAWIRPGSLLPLKLVLIAADLALLGMLSRSVPRRFLPLYAWCPLVLIEVSFNAHADIIGAAFLVAAWRARAIPRPVTAGALTALAVGTKILALPAAPFVLAETGVAGLGALATTLAALYAPFLLQGSWVGMDSVGAFARSWEFNASVFAVLRTVLSDTDARVACGVAFVLAYALLLRRRRDIGREPIDLAFGLLFLLSPVVDPWYLLWLVPFAVERPRAWSVAALALVSLSYVTGATTGRTQSGLYWQPAWSRLLEYGLVALAVLGDAAARTLCSRGAGEPTRCPRRYRSRSACERNT
jgi:hypothetical protein